MSIPHVGELFLGGLPPSWHARRLKVLLERNDGGAWGGDPSGEGDTVVLRSTEQSVDGRWSIEEPALRRLSPEERRATLLLEGDLVLTKSSGSSLHIGKTTLVDAAVAACACGYSNFMQRLRTGPGLHPKLAWYLINHRLVREQFDVMSNSTTGLANLSAGLVGSVLIPVPPLVMQPAIVGFLDRETGKIDALVTEQRRLIELLKEKRQAVLSHVVTKGPDPNARMKPSGVEELGEVPAHWTVSKLGRRWQLQGGFAFASSDFGPEGIPLVRMNNLNRGRLELEDATRVPPEVCSDRNALRAGDLVWGMSGSVGETGSLGNYARVSEQDLPAQLNQRVGRFVSVHPEANVDYLEILIQSQVFYQQVLGYVTGTAQFNISSDQVQGIIVAFPPTLEMNSILGNTGRTLRRYDELIREAEMATQLLQQRRAALISAAVTGKIDVRSLAALPEMAE